MKQVWRLGHKFYVLLEQKGILKFRPEMTSSRGSNSLRRLSLLDTSCLALPGAKKNLRNTMSETNKLGAKVKTPLWSVPDVWYFSDFGWSNGPMVHWFCGEMLPTQTTSWNLWFLSTEKRLLTECVWRIWWGPLCSWLNEKWFGYHSEDTESVVLVWYSLSTETADSWEKAMIESFWIWMNFLLDDACIPLAAMKNAPKFKIWGRFVTEKQLVPRMPTNAWSSRNVRSRPLTTDHRINNLRLPSC